MKWNDDKSLCLTRIFVWLSAAALAALCVSAPWIFSWFIRERMIFSGYYIHNSHPGGSGSLYDEPAAGQY